MEKNDILEITRLMQEGGGLSNDLGEVMEVLKNTLEKKYVKKIHAAARARQEETVSHPPKEVTLLRAMRAFTNESGRMQMDNMINAMLMMNTIQNINHSVSEITRPAPGLLQAMSSDGRTSSEPVEVMPDQEARIAGLLMTLALTDMI